MQLQPDIDLSKRFVAANPPPGEIVLVAVTGSHHYGFPSPDSDIDLKGIHAAPLHRLLGLSAPRETHDRLEVFEEVECDLTTHELRKALGLLLRGNGNVLERIFSPFQLYQTDAVEELRAHARATLSKACFGHYAGYCHGMQREHLRDEIPKAKSLLYTFRVALTGIHLLESGTIEANIRTLAPRYGFDELIALADRKCSTAERTTLEPAEAERYRSRWDELMSRLEHARDHSELPDAPPSSAVAALDDWLVAMRQRSQCETDS